jgi:hypothetical protein
MVPPGRNSPMAAWRVIGRGGIYPLVAYTISISYPLVACDISKDIKPLGGESPVEA